MPNQNDNKETLEEKVLKRPKPDFFVTVHFARFRGAKYMVEEDSTGERCGGIFIPLMKNGIDPRRRYGWRMFIGAIQDWYANESTHHACICVSAWQYMVMKREGYLEQKPPMLGSVITNELRLKYPPMLLNDGSYLGLKKAMMLRDEKQEEADKRRGEVTQELLVKDEKQAKEMHAKTFINDFQKKMRERLLKRHKDND